MNRITFFTKPDCSLCHSALYVVERVRQQVPFELEIVDISACGNEKWRDVYREHIPVVHLDGKEVSRHGVDERELREVLRCHGRRD